MDKEYFMREALSEAKKAFEIGEIPIGAVIVKNEKIIARGHNLKEKYNDPTMHAEIIAIKKASEYLNNWWLENCDLYVTFEPCAMCAGAILNARMRKVFFAVKDYRMGACGTKINLSDVDGFNHKFEVESGILEDEALALIQKFFKNLRSKNS